MTDSSLQGAPMDRYVVQEYLAEGGMGAIYIGRKMGAGGFSKPVVLKQLLPEFTSQREFRDLFLREARLSATLDHANIVHTIDLVNAGEDFFIVMEYVPGADLRTLLKKTKRRGSRFSPAAGIYVTRELLSALQYAHQKRGLDGTHLRLIHRDVSPSNVLVSAQGEVKLTDFGIAKASTHNSMFYRVKGKIGYMSPEQAKSEDLDHRSDLYSLAVCLYEMIAGERLFVKAGLATSAEEMYSQPVPHLSRTIRGIPIEFDQLMLKALHVDPDRRYQTAGAFQDALQRCAHRAGLLMSTPELSAHLRELCGEPDQWRKKEEGGDHVKRDRPETEEYRGGGTEILGPEEDDVEDDRDFVSMDAGNDPFAVIDERERRSKRSRSSHFDLERLQGMELTSMIDISRQRPSGRKRRQSGSQPLIDINGFGFAGGGPGVGRPGVGGPGVGPHGSDPAAALDAHIGSLEAELEPGPEPYGHGAQPHSAQPWTGPAGPSASPSASPQAASPQAASPNPMPSSMPGPGAGQSAGHQPGPSSRPVAPYVPPPVQQSLSPPVQSKSAAADKPPKRSRLGLVIVLILLVALGIAAAIAIGLSGPKMGETQDDPSSEKKPPTAPDDETP